MEKQMKHTKLCIIALLVCGILALAGCAITGNQTSAQTESVQQQPVSSQSIPAETAMPAGTGMETMPGIPTGMRPDMNRTGEPATFASTVETGIYTASVSSPDNPQTYYDPEDVVGNYEFQDIAISLNGTEFTTDNGTEVSITQNSDGNIVIKNSGKGLYNYILSGDFTGTVMFTSDKANYMVTLAGLDITGTTLPALQLKSTTKAFVNLAEGTNNNVADSTDNDKKGAMTSGGDVIFCGEGALTVTAYKKHAVKIDGTVRITSGTINIVTDEKAEGNGIHADDAFIMDAGDLTINSSGTVYGEEGKGIKVNGREADVEKGLEAKGYLVVNGGTITVTSVGKAMTAGWKLAEDAETESTADDPTPNLIVNNGVIIIQPTGTPYEVSEDESLSPEGLEAKASMVVNGGLIQITTTDDALNAGENITINGGTMFVHSSQADAVDSNGTIVINSGTVVALGSGVPEMGLDCDENSRFSYVGGTIVAMGGAGNNTPEGSLTTGRVITYGDALSAGTALALTDASGNVIVGFTVPDYYTSGSASLLASDAINSGEAYSISTGGTLISESAFNGLALGNVSYTGGTEAGSVTVESTVSHIGSAIMGFGHGGFGGGFGNFNGDFVPGFGRNGNFDGERPPRGTALFTGEQFINEGQTAGNGQQDGTTPQP
jgi:hypothetical protein